MSILRRVITTLNSQFIPVFCPMVVVSLAGTCQPRVDKYNQFPYTPRKTPHFPDSLRVGCVLYWIGGGFLREVQVKKWRRWPLAS